MTPPILLNCPFCGEKIQHFIGHASGHYAYYCTHSKKIIILYEDLHEKIMQTGLERELRERIREYIQSSDEFEIYLTMEKMHKIEAGILSD
ncbi:TPA: hypothetical protein DCG86_07645 [Candidatus Marinimicrobia bacterium]|nr:MAG: hypothetical protein XE04_1496 [Marinimicrobia bacterium 46_43]HAE87882.1 hypothetical protein [Candidatus Neomarinimicrobiota bacterium]HBY18143.1 hypothetical protein [Candidatus Neomarinimicrobiota bacterium]